MKPDKNINTSKNKVVTVRVKKVLQRGLSGRILESNKVPVSAKFPERDLAETEY